MASFLARTQGPLAHKNPFASPRSRSLIAATSRSCIHSTNYSQVANSRHQKYDRRVFRVSQEIEEAVSTRRPVVALESTVYTHGYPYTDSVDLALHFEDVVRSNGAIPATIGIVDGIARVGLEREELIKLASTAGDPKTMKVSRRDMAFIIGLGLAGRKVQGGTTISGTMLLAEMAGIEVFGTTGLGGVHRGGESTMDISADLTELGRTGVTVISSGCKSFLDIPRTFEYLETQGVCVGTFADGRVDESIEIPSFYSRDSGTKSPAVIQDETEAANIIFARRLMNIKSGILFANPIPEEFSIPASEIDAVIQSAIQEAADKGVNGSSNTPFVLARIKERTAGRSLPANKVMMESNLAKAARVAVELSKLQ